jgi:hypothetical protein
MSAFMPPERALVEENRGGDLIFRLVRFDPAVALCLEMKPVPRARGVYLVVGLLLGAWVTFDGPPPAYAGTSDIVTRVACPALPTDVRAEFEARAQVDLTLRSAGGGELVATCHGLAAKVAWHPKTGGSFERDVSAATPAALVDALLFAVAELATEAARVDAAASAAAGGERKEPEPSESPPAAAADKPPVEAPRPPQSEGGSRAIPFGFVVGGTAALYSTSGSGIAGPNLGLLFGLPSNVLVTVQGAYGFGFGADPQVSIHTIEGMALVSTVFGAKRAFELGGGAVVGSLSATAEGSQYTPAKDSLAYFAAVFRGRYGALVSGARVSFGPEIRLNLPPTQVLIQSSPNSSTTVWQISALTVGLTIDVASSLYGSLW